MANTSLARTRANVQETAVAPAYSQPTTPAESGPRQRLHTEPATPYSLRVSTIERVLAALESDDVAFDAYAAIECMPLGQAMRIAASRPAVGGAK